MDTRSNGYQSSSASKIQNGNHHGANNYCRTGRTFNKKSSGLQNTRKKPTFIGFNYDKLKAMIADEAGLDHISTQLQHLEKAVVQYIPTSMSAYASKAMKSLKPYDFKKHIPQPVSEEDYTMDVLTDGNVTGTTTDQGQKTVLESILLSDISDYCKKCSKYHKQMHSMYGLIRGNIDQNIITLIETGSTYTKISIEHDPIELMKLLRKL